MPREGHFVTRSNWLRAVMLGANDGIVSTASLLVGMASTGLGREAVLLAGLAGLTAGALSMAAGEYVSVSTQADIETADLERERVALAQDPDYELGELAAQLEGRGLDAPLALVAAQQLTDHDALGAHAREELGMFGDMHAARPLQAAGASALAFALGAALPLGAAVLAPSGVVVAAVALLALMLLGATGARLGGAPVWPSVRRVSFWGSVAMAGTSAVGYLFGVVL